MEKKSNHSLLKVLIFSAFFQFILVSTCFAQTKVDKIDKLISQYSKYDQFNGTVLVAENGNIIYKKGFGLANMEWKIPNEPNTKFRLGSITKQFTALLILQLVEQGKLKLDVPISTYLPDYSKTNGDKITIHQLLTHSSGIPNYTSFPNFFKETSRNPYTPEAFVKTFADLPLEFKPGEKFSYSNSGYFVLGYIIEKVTGKTYEQCLQDNIFTPLMMKNSGYDHHDIILANRATGYERKERSDMSNYMNSSYIDMSLPYAAGSLYSTVEDLYLWDQALYTDKLLSANSKKLLFDKYINTRFSPTSYYGYGWFIEEASIDKTDKKVQIIEHGGGINGFNTLISRIPSSKDLIVLLNNTGGTGLNEMSKAIRAILYDMPYDTPKRSAAYALLNIIKAQGLETGLKNLEEFKKSNEYAIKENEMNYAGYELLQSGKTKEAIAVFKANVDAFPKSGNAYDSLGEAYLKDGDKKLAILNYKKSIQLDPKNESGKKTLEEISK
ncbi:serine hydrolase [Flavobacterium sp. LS1R49]|uniref:Serine hydrolase n=1 Tax=Flavobacterium shii TaxID=2987687 RepID=A0A9X3C418_9FLAO|nr:serine hydrolase [Flavobacterium shii]MCV9926519.1 serine hydrolase [Flavobacterium shii]